MLTTKIDAGALMCPLMSSREAWANCSGPHCAAWRWAEHPPIRKFWPAKDPQAKEPEGPRPTNGGAVFVWSGYSPGDDDGAGWLETEQSAANRRKGFCGLAGEPRDEP